MIQQLCETHSLIPLFIVRATEVQRACSLDYGASNWQILHLNDSRDPARSATICCPGLDFCPTLCMFCWVSLVLEMQRGAVALKGV